MDDRSKQLKGGVILSYLTLALSNIVALVYTPFMLRMMGQSEYGLYSLVASIVSYLTILDFGFGNAIIRYTAKYKAEGKIEEQYSLFGMLLGLYICIGLLSLILGYGLYMNVDYLFDKTMTTEELSKARLMILLLVFNIAITFPLSIFPSIIIAYENFIFHKLVNLARVLLQPCLMVPLLLMGYKAVGMVVLITTLNILTLSVCCWYCFYRLNVRIIFKGLHVDLFKEISVYSFYVFLTIIVDRAFWSTGQFILGVLSGTADVAIYSIVVQLCNYYMGFSIAISGMFLPKMTQLIVDGRKQNEISDMFIKVGRIQFIILLYILGGFILFGKDFVFYWAGQEYSLVYPLTIIIMIPQTIPLIQNLGISILQAQNRQRFRSWLNVLIALISVFIGYLLTKKYGIIGCAISTGSALLLGHGVILNCYYKKYIHLDIAKFWRQIFTLILPMFLICPLVYGFSSIGSSFGLILIGVVIYSILYGIALWFVGFNSFEKELVLKPILNFKLKLRK